MLSFIARLFYPNRFDKVRISSVYKAKVLIIGGRSAASKDFAEIYKSRHQADFYGLTSKMVTADSFNGPIKLFEYRNIDKIGSLNFDLVCVFATRLPHEKLELKGFLSVNSKIISVLEKIKYGNDAPRILFISTFSVYPQTSLIISENSKLQLDDFYSKSKALMEQNLFSWGASRNIPILVARMPVFLYRNVCTNFMARLMKACRSGHNFTLTNIDSPLEAVFDMASLVTMAKCDITANTIVNCSAQPDITFREIGEIAKGYGLEEVIWREAARPSTKVSKKQLKNLIGSVPSAKSMILDWFEKENEKGQTD